MGLSVLVPAASAEPTVQHGAVFKSEPESAVTLIHGHGGHFGGGGGSFSGKPGGYWSYGKPGGNWKYGKPGGNWKYVKPGGYSKYGEHHHHIPHGARWGFRHGRRGYWWGGSWYWDDSTIGVYGDRCYLNCINEGNAPGYCGANSWNFCY
jgi:hypothetical protein